MAQGEKLPDNCCPPATLTELQNFIVISEYEIRAKATIQHKDGALSGAFVFHKTIGGSWIIDSVEFHEPEDFMFGSRWIENVYQKVK